MRDEDGPTVEQALPRAGGDSAKISRGEPAGLIADLEWALAGQEGDEAIEEDHPTLRLAVIEQALSSGGAEPGGEANWDLAALITGEQTSPGRPASAASPEGWSDEQTPIAALKARLAAFAEERDWARFHQPRDLAMAVAVEAGELLELFLWVDPAASGPALPGGRPAPEQRRLEAEIADVAICLLNLCHRTGVDLAGAVARKLEQNAEKYPVERAKGSALKYDEYR